MGLCDCCSSPPELFLYGLCCPVVHLSDMYASAGVNTFVHCFILGTAWYSLRFLLSVAIGLVLYEWRLGDAIANGIFAVVFSFKSGTLRERFGGHGCTCVDCICWWCCSCCAIIQEARLVDGAMGVHTACCCRLTAMPQTEALVGVPVVMLQPLRAGSQRELSARFGDGIGPWRICVCPKMKVTRL